MNPDIIDLLDKNFDLAVNAPDGIKRLRAMILTLAMQGQLVPQDPKDQSASELLKDIEAEKKRLVKEGKIKEPKPLPPIKPEEVLYEVPTSWEWVRFGEVSNIRLGKMLDKSKNKGNLKPYLRNTNVQWDEIGLDDIKEMKISDDEVEEFKVCKGDLLICEGGEPGRCAIWKHDNIEMYFQKALHRVRPYSEIMVEFLKNCLLNDYDNGTLEKSYTGATIKHLPGEKLDKYIFPLPPLAEQHRIVAKIDELMARVDELERKRDARNEKRLAMHQAAIARLLDAGDANASRSGRDFIFAHFAELYGTKENVAELRKAILQLAVMGRLVPQDQQDQPASELLKEIEAEKKRLVREGKIKEPKPLSPIKQEEVPYQVPKGWEWVRLGELVSKLGSGSTPKGGKESYSDEGIMFFRSQNIYDDGLRTENISCITPAIHEKMSGTKILPFDILFNITGGSLGRSALVPEDFSEGNISQHVCIIRPVNLNNDYIHKLTISAIFQNQIPGGITGSGREGLQKNRMELFVIPLPPLAEQRRIVAKVDELMALCDKLDKQIDERTAKESALLEAVAARV